MSTDIVAQKYSQALYEVAQGAGKEKGITEEFSKITQSFLEPSVLAFFQSPFNSLDHKMAAAKAALEGKCSAEVYNFVLTLIQNDRLGALKEISEQLSTKLSTSSGVAEGTLYYASEPSAEFKAQLEAKLQETLKRKVKLKLEKDPTLMSGFKVDVGGWVLDDSTQFHLKKLKNDLSKRGI